MKKWSTIFKLKKYPGLMPFVSMEDEWICTDFGHTINSDKIDMFVMQPLHAHPNGERFGRAPHGFEVLIVSDEQLVDYFEELPDRDYYEEQRKIEERIYKLFGGK